MKRFLLLLGISLISLISSAQEATTNWPYIYNDFTPAALFMQSGERLEYSVNINLVNGKLHYLEGEKIKEVKSSDIVILKIGNTEFMNVGDKMMEIVAQESRGFVAMLRKADLSKLNETGGAYGSSSNTLSTKALSSLENVTNTSYTSHMNIKNSKEDGKTLPIVQEYYIVSNRNIYPASKKDIEALIPMDKKDNFKSFLKTHKIKWKDPKSLLQLIDFFN